MALYSNIIFEVQGLKQHYYIAMLLLRFKVFTYNWRMCGVVFRFLTSGLRGPWFDPVFPAVVSDMLSKL